MLGVALSLSTGWACAAEYPLGGVNDDLAWFVDGPLPSGSERTAWVMTVYGTPQAMGGRRIQVLRFQVEADCAGNRTRMTMPSGFDAQGRKVALNGRLDDWVQPKPGTMGAQQAELLCGSLKTLPVSANSVAELIERWRTAGPDRVQWAADRRLFAAVEQRGALFKSELEKVEMAYRDELEATGIQLIFTDEGRAADPDFSRSLAAVKAAVEIWSRFRGLWREKQADIVTDLTMMSAGSPQQAIIINGFRSGARSREPWLDSMGRYFEVLGDLIALAHDDEAWWDSGTDRLLFNSDSALTVANRLLAEHNALHSQLWDKDGVPLVSPSAGSSPARQ